ncbi:hypothetical protein BJ878DRAFT_63360 [Calycina marina]|uniref:Uncharacterized protein n=1 Tax=Calycina marina TaxID=1763456 RepID=A0A9P7Z2V3_9HELO|nr:hypothetical protein BJ878DRAFT_63360 [Calycina marina]
MPNLSPISPLDARAEMFQKGEPRDQFFDMKALAPRPTSNATEMFDTDFEDDSEVETESPRFSSNSSARRSETTLSSFEEVHTPSPNQEFQGFNFEMSVKKAVEGPRGPHLFRTSIQSDGYDDEYILGMSPMTSKPSDRQYASPTAPQVPQIPQRHFLTVKTDVNDALNLEDLARWTPRQVGRWMWDAGLEQSIVEKFEENDISGAILITLKFEDLRELDIPSFGQRTKVWNEIHVMRGSAPSTPKPSTPIEETMVSPCTEIRRSPFQVSRNESAGCERSRDCDSDDEHKEVRRRKSSRRRHHRKHNEPITPLESVSIVGIEQLMPKPHSCSRGENCSKWRRQQRLIEAFKNDHPVSPEKGGSIWVAGNPGNPATAPAVTREPRPTSDAVDSMVASSDVLGPGIAPIVRPLEEQSLRALESRDPQHNVKQFIQFQHMDPYQVQWSSEVPPTPPYEIFPAVPAPHNGLRDLPRLAIPPPRPPPRSISAGGFSPYRMDRVEAMSPDLRNETQSPGSIYRFGTPFSEMDIPLTAIPLGPVSRDASQSVPPNMSYRMPLTPLQRTQSRSSARRPSFAMPRVDENTSSSIAPPRPQPPEAFQQRNDFPEQHQPQTVDDLSHAGLMKKRKTKMLRHEWHEHHFTLKGTRLAMHTDARAIDTLEYIDVDDYAIACSSLASGSKLNAAFKAMSISRGNKDKKDETAFSFQLIPTALEKGSRLKKRDSAIPGSGEANKSKTHYFAVKSRDDRIDWMRELMLAKALKQKNEGYEINVNGNMI